MRKRSIVLVGVSAATFAFTLLAPFATPEARAETIIKRPNDHPNYRAELEPHATFIPWRPVGYRRSYRRDAFREWEVGAGFRATIELADPAFIPKLNNTIGITFGADITGCAGCYYGNYWYMRAPVGLQWNFWLFKRFNAFAEFGVQPLVHRFFDDIFFDFFAQVGGRVMFSDKVAFTFRVGYPYVTLGVSFFVGK